MVCTWEFLVLYDGCLKLIAALSGSDLAAGNSISHGLGTQERTELAEDGRAKKGEDQRKSCHSLKETFSHIFFQKTSLTITWLECTSPSTLILIIGQSWNLNHLPCHFQSIQGFCLTLVWKDKDGEMDIDLLNPDAKEEKAGKL